MSITFNLVVEENLPMFGLTGTCTVWEGDPTSPPTNIIKLNEPWGVTFNWSTTGALNNILTGNWYLYVYLEKMGAQEGPPDRPPEVVAFVQTPTNYTKPVNFGPNYVTPGLYRITTALTLVGPGGPAPVAAVGDGPLIQFFISP